MAMEDIKEHLYNLLAEKKGKPDFLDLDKDGEKKEPMKKAAKDADKGQKEAYEDKKDKTEKCPECGKTGKVKLMACASCGCKKVIKRLLALTTQIATPVAIFFTKY